MAMHFPNLPERVAEIRARLKAASDRGGHGQTVTLVAVTKTHGPEAAIEAWEAGVPDCGENRIQEALPKMAAVDVPVSWHLIGHLQRNKVHELEHFTLLHSLDSSRLADAVCEFGLKREVAVDVLVQVNTSGEATKGGFSPEALRVEADRLTGMPGIRVVGAMTMAPLDASELVLRQTFAGARHARQVLAEAGHPAIELSMGMSNDYEIAVEEGATLVRIGSALFGARDL
ncbi:MAG TPA: YggS family pyridoxal phosphate-dependent enzyme [Gemmatimonadaceae bacterium]